MDREKVPTPITGEYATMSNVLISAYHWDQNRQWEYIQASSSWSGRRVPQFPSSQARLIVGQYGVVSKHEMVRTFGIGYQRLISSLPVDILMKSLQIRIN